MKKVLLIDDEKDAADSLSSWFEDKGYSIKTAYSGKEGIEYVMNFNPDVVVTDIKMPDMSGLEVLSAIKEYDEMIQVIVITAFDDMDTTIEAIQKGAYDYLAKPLDIKRLELSVRRAIENRKQSQKLELLEPENLTES